MYIYIYIYIHNIHIPIHVDTNNANNKAVIRAGRVVRPCRGSPGARWPATADLRTKILDFGGFDSNGILSLRGGVLMSMGNSPETLRQHILVAGFLVC